jgi:hypothetical protein
MYFIFDTLQEVNVEEVMRVLLNTECWRYVWLGRSSVKKFLTYSPLCYKLFKRLRLESRVA